MRRSVCLLALAGCNQIFGLDDNAKLGDGGAPDDTLTFPTVKLNYQVATTELVGGNIVATPVQNLSLVPIDPEPSVRIATAGGNFVSTTYDGGDVALTIPDLAAQPWRLELAIPGEAPRELQWHPQLDRARITVPLHGRLPRTPPPDGAGYVIVPKDGSATTPDVGAFRLAHVFVTGTFIDIFADTDPTKVRLAAGQGEPADPMTFSGPLGSPDAGPGDFAVLVNYGSTTTCRRLTDGYAEFRPPPLMSSLSQPLDNNLQQNQPTWARVVDESATITYANAAGLDAPAVRLSVSLGGIAANGGRDLALRGALVQYGYTAHVDSPAFVAEPSMTGRVGNGAFETMNVPSPLLFVLAECDFTGQPTALTGFATPPTSRAFPRIAYSASFNHRTVNGADLVSSIVTTGKVESTGQATLDFAVPFAQGPITLEDGGAPIDLTGSSDGVPISAGSGRFDLRFKVESGSIPFVADYFEVAVYRLGNNRLGLVRTYVSVDVAVDANGLNATPIRIDRSLFETGSEYVLAVRVVRGRPNAMLGDFEQLTYPHAMTTLFTRTFVVE